MTFIFVYKVILRIKKKRKPDKNGSMIQTGDLCKEHQYSMDIYKTLLSTETKQRYRKRQYRKKKKAQNLQSDCLNMELKSLPYLFHIFWIRNITSQNLISFFLLL